MSTPLRVSGLVKSFGRTPVLEDLSLEIPRGAVSALVGLNGAGKTTTIECCLGLLRPEAGRIEIVGVAPSRLHTTRGVVGVVFDSPCLHPNLSVRSMLEYAARLCGRRADDPARLESMLGLEPYRSRKIKKLSLGNRRRASIAQALIGRPELVLLDEPFSGLDASGVDDLIALVGDLNSENGTTFVLSSHQLAYLERVATHMAILGDGRIAASGPVSELLAGRGTRLTLRVSDRGRARDVLAGRPRLRIDDGRDDDELLIELGESGAEPHEINRRLVESGLEVSELLAQPPTLEGFFRETVGGPAK